MSDLGHYMDVSGRLKRENTDLEELLIEAWGVIANASGGNWTLESAEWRAAAERWRDRYHRHLDLDDD